ncbi:class I SAM-dependent methyltransferase [Phytoactinopolyspora limicola]|uniref:class I SAM-dependent methyltransferase n=1 Tax=Phytoactinopolyspora limicola TaxID=2715536 RepID=UPI001408DF02|nr:methyltransferase domain-containing protein [Phytoactinopolyspora limicola]
MPQPDTKTTVAAAFHTASTNYERIGPRFFDLFGHQLVEYADVRPGMRVLDVGSGAGAALIPAATATGPSGRVLGIDLAPGMVRRLTEVIDGRGWSHVSAQLGDAEDPPADPAGWDRILAAQVLFFLPAPEQAVVRFHELLRPGGVLAFSTWGPDDPDWAPVYRALFGYIPEGAAPRLTPSGDTFKSDQHIAELLQGAGFDDIHHETTTYDVVYQDAEQWLQWTRTHGAVAFWEAIPPDRVASARADAITALDQLRAPDGQLHMPTAVRYTVTTRR